MKKKIIDIFSLFFEKQKFSGLFVGVFAFILIIPFSFTDVYESFELKLFDARFQLKPSIKEWDKLYFIDIDDNSTASLGQFPWTRDVYAKGLNTIKEIGVSQTTLDIMFPDPSPIQISQEKYTEIKKSIVSKVKINSERVSEIIKNNDEIFSKSIKENGNTILSYTFSTDPPNYEISEKMKTNAFQRSKSRFEHLSSIKIPENQISRYSGLKDDRIQSLVYPIPELMDSAKTFGFVNRFTDIDGTIRKVRLVRLFKNRVYFNLALSMLIDICNVKKQNIVINPGTSIVLKNAFDHRLQKFRDITIPIDDKGMLYVNWAGPGPREKSFKILPFFALLEYPVFVDYVYNMFEEKFSQQWINSSAEINGKIQELNKKYTSVNDEERLSIYLKIQDQINKLKKLKISLLNSLIKEKLELEKKLANNKNNNLKKQIAELTEDIKKTDLIIRTEEISNKMCIVGLTATGTHDIASIPLHNEYPAVGTYLNTVNTIINEQYINKPEKTITFLITILISLLSGISIQRLHARLSLLTGILLFIILNATAIILFVFLNIWIDQLGTNLALLLPSVTLISFKLVREESDKKFIKNAFSRYLAPDYIEQIIRNPDLLQLGGQSEVITTFFSDVAGFSTLSESITPAELVIRLNEYLQEMTDIIISHGGTVDKYEGDAIMAFYGAPIPHSDHELRACLAAIDMKAKLRELQEHWRKIGKKELFVRMGMNTGEAIVGNMGSRIKMDYTAMGDSVNLASRLEGANKVYNTVAMISVNTQKAVKDSVETRELDIIKVVGKNEPTAIYELLGKKGSLPDKVYECIENYNKGLELFRGRQWKRALRYFNDALKILPDDGPSITYIKRCEEFMKKPPSAKWDGIFTMKSK